MQDLVKHTSHLPVKLEDLAKFVLVGREKLTAVRALIKAMDKVEMAKEVRDQKMQEAQMLSEALIDAEAAIGRLAMLLETSKGKHQNRGNQYKSGRGDSAVPSSTSEEKNKKQTKEKKTKEETLKELGFNKKQVQRFEALAENEDIVEAVKAEARENDDIVNRTMILNAINEKKKENVKKEKQRIVNEAESFQAKEVEVDIDAGWYKVGNQYLYFGSNTDAEFIDNLPKAKFAFADPPYNANVDTWDSGFVWQQDYLQDKADVVAVTPGGWNALNFYKETNMNYIWEMFCWISNGMTHGKCGFANVIKTSIFGNVKPKISQDFWKISIKLNENDDTKHHGRKPYDFMIHLIDLFTKEGDTVIDCFAGSGTTMVLCEKMNRVSYNAEMNKQYCIDIIKRIGSHEPVKF
jgi:16S rRNA G966 N2-methylase RsmD